MRPSALRYGVVLGLVLCAGLLPGFAVAVTNPCTNSINGETTNEQVVGDIKVVGCNNVIDNNTVVDGDFELDLTGSGNIIRDNVQLTKDLPFTVIGSDNKFIANEAGDAPVLCARCRQAADVAHFLVSLLTR
jgi:hypothetical protein